MVIVLKLTRFQYEDESIKLIIAGLKITVEE